MGEKFFWKNRRRPHRGGAALRSAAVAAALALATGCTADPPATNRPAAAAAPAHPSATPTLEKRVLARHDSLMFLTDRLYGLRQRLIARRAALPPAAPLAARLDSATRATLLADDAMMDWMHTYRRPAATTPPDSAVAYYHRQLRLLAEVDRLTHRALDSAAVLLGPAPSPTAR